MLAINGGTPVLPPGSAAPWPIVTADDKAAVLRAMDLATPWHWPMAPVLELEDAWAEFTGSRYAVAANSGTAALHMAVAAVDVQPGDEVIAPADTFLSGASCALHHNALPVFVDVDPDTYNIDPTSVSERITPRTRAVVAADLNGLPADYDALYKITAPRDIRLIGDGSQAHGATYKRRQVGSLADVSAVSLNGSKPLSALGEGGLLTTDNPLWRDQAVRLRMFGEDEGRGRGPRDYNARLMGWNYRIDVMAAAFARSQLRRLPDMTRLRTANGDHLTAILADVPGIKTPTVPDGSTHVYFFYPVLVTPEQLNIKISVADFRVAFRLVMEAEGVTMEEWQPRPLPAQTLFQEQIGYGRGCPWSCGHAQPGIAYHPEDYPVATDICVRRLVLGQTFSSLAPPADTALMDRYGDAFHKVLVDERDELIKYVLGSR